MTDPRQGAVLVLTPASWDPVRGLVESPEDAHCTLLLLGSADLAEQAELRQAVSEAAGSLDGPVIALTSGVAILGDDRARVVLIEADELNLLRDRISSTLLASQGIGDAEDKHPHYVPHLTLNYTGELPEVDLIPPTVTLDRIELWTGTERFAVPFGRQFGRDRGQGDKDGDRPDWEIEGRAQVAALTLVPNDPDPDDPGSIARYLRFCDDHPSSRIFAIKSMHRLGLSHLVEPMHWPEFTERMWTDELGIDWRAATQADVDRMTDLDPDTAAVAAAVSMTGEQFWSAIGRRPLGQAPGPEPEPESLIERTRRVNAERGFTSGRSNRAVAR